MKSCCWIGQPKPATTATPPVVLQWHLLAGHVTVLIVRMASWIVNPVVCWWTAWWEVLARATCQILDAFMLSFQFILQGGLPWYQQCPDGLRLITSPKRTCGRATPLEGCASVVYQTHGHEYSQVCGRIKAYQFGELEVFSAGSRWLLDGTSLYIYSQPQHVWSFVVGKDEVSSGQDVCPCNIGFSGVTINTTILFLWHWKWKWVTA